MKAESDFYSLSTEVSTDHVEINLIQYLKYLYTYRYVLAVVTVAVPAFIGLYSFFVKKPIYRTKVVINVNMMGKEDSLAARPLSFWAIEKEMINKMNLTQQFFISHDYRKALLNEVSGKTHLTQAHPRSEKHKKLIRQYFFRDFELRDDQKADILVGPLDLELDLERYELSLVTRTPNPLVSAALADIAAYTLEELNLQNLLKRVQVIRNFLETQLHETKSRLNHLEQQLVEIQMEGKVLSIDTVRNQVNKDWIQQESHRKEIARKLQANMLLVGELEQELKLAREHLVTQGTGSYLYLGEVQKRLDLLKYQKELLGGRAIASEEKERVHDGLENAVSDLRRLFSGDQKGPLSMNPWDYFSKLESLLVDLKQKGAELRSEMDANEKMLKKTEKEFMGLPTTLQKLSRLTRDIDWTAELLGGIQTRLQETKIKEAGRSNDLVILSPAEIPTVASGMSIVRKFAVSTIGGLTLGVMLLLLGYIIVPTLRDVGELQKLGFHVIGALPLFRSQQQNLLGAQVKPTLILKDRPQSFDAHAVRHARFKLERALNLSQARQDGRGRVMTVVSVDSNEGKSFCAANLAYGLSKAEFSVLLVDLDVRQPCLYSYFQDFETHSRNIELSSQDSKVSFRMWSINEKLDLVDAPQIKQDFVDYLESDLSDKIMENIRESFDFIIIDTPPLRSHLEPQIAAQYSDAVLFVVNQRKTLRQDLIAAHSNLTENFQGQTLALLNFSLEDIKSIKKDIRLGA